MDKKKRGPSQGNWDAFENVFPKEHPFITATAILLKAGREKHTHKPRSPTSS